MIIFVTSTWFPLLMIVAGVGDALSMRIPNHLNVLIALSFFPLAWIAGMPLSMFGLHLVTSLAILVAGYALFTIGLFGGGDAKLMAAAGLWLGYPHVQDFLLLTAVFGGVLAVVVASWSLTKRFLHSETASGGRLSIPLRVDVPYGVALAAGAIIAFSQSWWTGTASP